LNKVKTEPVLRVVNDQKCCPTYTRDLAKVIREQLKTDYKGFINVVNPEGCNWFDFTKEILKAAKIKNIRLESITSEQLGLPAKRPANSALSTNKLENEIGIKIRKRKEALPDFLEELNKSSGIQ
ncbi:NAD(P)-dependent oxidoreductase, partial [bacterium]|nr:NAD(P)-dependent oxidoreductase [bacterium]